MELYQWFKSSGSLLTCLDEYLEGKAKVVDRLGPKSTLPAGIPRESYPVTVQFKQTRGKINPRPYNSPTP